jgi:ATP-dependent Clp protease ATP-binding subunit ClpA
MFDRFTEGARQTVVLANEEARQLDHKYIGTEHLLAALLRNSDAVPARVLGEMGVTLDEVRVQIVRVAGRGEAGKVEQIPFTPSAKSVLTRSLAAARSLSMDMIGTEHILLGLTREPNGVGVRILLELGAEPDAVGHRLLLALGEPRALANQAAETGRRLLAIEARLAAFERREEVARIAGQAADPAEAARQLSSLLDLEAGQAEAVLQARVSDWTAAERARLEQERDRLRAELPRDN